MKSKCKHKSYTEILSPGRKSYDLPNVWVCFFCNVIIL